METLLKEEYIKREIDYRKKKIDCLLQEYTTMSHTDIMNYCKIEFNIIDKLRQELDKIE